MTQNLMFLCGRKTAIALLDETLYAMIDPCRIRDNNLGILMQGEPGVAIQNPKSKI